MTRANVCGMAVLVTQLLLAGAGLASLESCAEMKTVAEDNPSRIEQVRLGFALGQDGQVAPGTVASTFSVRDPIHLSVQAQAAEAGSVLRVAVRDVATNRVVWSDVQPLPPGSSSHTFEFGQQLEVGRYRAESTVGRAATNPLNFVVHERLRG